MRRMFVLCGVLSVIVTATGFPAVACYWDYDTLNMERRQFPTVLELITGKFLRHSPEYYRWRIKDRNERLVPNPKNLAWHDDLAVAYDKVGLHAKAIETMLQKETLKPGMYETYANLGTLYIHSGQLKKGLEQIKRAIEINPNAHFGREVYQQLLVEYVLEVRENGRKELPLSQGDRGGGRERTFASFVLARRQTAGDPSKELARAVKGVLGMMRFGNFDSPILLEALGDLLGEEFKRGDPREGAKRLAARAYLKASYEAKNEKTKNEYRRIAERTLRLQSSELTEKSITLARLELRFESELEQTREWYAQLGSDEKSWIAAGVDVDSEFNDKYYEEPQLTLNEPSRFQRMMIFVGRFPIPIGLCVCVFVLIPGVLLSIWRRHRKRLRFANDSGNLARGRALEDREDVAPGR